MPLPYRAQPDRQYRYHFTDFDYSTLRGGCQPGNDAGTQSYTVLGSQRRMNSLPSSIHMQPSAG